MAKDKKSEPGKNRHDAPVISRKKKLKEKAASDNSIGNSSHTTEHSLRITKDKKFKKVAKGSKKDILEPTKNKKRKLEDKGIPVESRKGDTSFITMHETGVLKGHKIRKSKSDVKKSRSLRKKVRKDKNEVDFISENVLLSNDDHNSDNENSGAKVQVLLKVSSSQNTEEASNGKASKGRKKKKIKKIKGQDIQITEKQGSPSNAEFEDVKEIQSIDEDCSRRVKTGAMTHVVHEISSPQSSEEASHGKTSKSLKKKIKKITKIRGNQLLEKQGSPSKLEFDGVDEIQSVDEDCSRGMKKWLLEYHENRPGIEVLHNRIDEFITSYEEQKEQEKKERQAQAAEGGWTVVVRHKGRKKTTDSESGISVGSVAQAAVIDNVAKKKPKEAPIDFYRFQKREAQLNELMLLKSKFEQDKKRIQQLRAARKFRPY